MSEARQCDNCEEFYKDQDLPHPVGWPRYEYRLVHINAGTLAGGGRTEVPVDICRSCLTAMIDKAESAEITDTPVAPHSAEQSR